MYYLLDDNEKKIAKLVAPLSVINNTNESYEDTLSLRRVSFNSFAQRFEITCNLEPTRSPKDLMSLLMKKGVRDRVLIEVPQPIDGGIHPTAVTRQVANIAARGQDVINLSLPIDVSMYDKTFVSFQGHTKIYLIDIISNSSFRVYPRLHKDVTVNSVVQLGAGVIMRGYLDMSTRKGIAFRDGVLADVGIVTIQESIDA
jgi:hypothetical protein